MRPIDADKIVFDYGGLAHIPTNDFIGIAKYFADQIKAMHTIAPPPNDPLTLDELREMDGEPVWVELINIDQPNAWFLLNLRDDEAVNKRGGFVSLMYYGKTWFAYRRKPDTTLDRRGEP